MGSQVLIAGGRPGVGLEEGPGRPSLRKLGCLGNKWQGSAGLQTYKMERVILQLQDRPNYKEQLRAVCREARIGLAVLSGFTLCKMRLFWERALRHYETNPTKAETTWFQNELRLFHWLLLSLSCIHAAPLAQLPSLAWQTITTVFFPKSTQMLRFEARKLISSSPVQQHRPWSAEEGRLLQSLMAERTSMSSWNDISRGLFQTSGGVLYRSGKQCREQWFNHLDPSKKHGEWTTQEDRALLRFVSQQGHRWAQLCREVLPHRTEHMIKNRFKSLLQRHPQAQQLSQRKLIRRILKEEKEQQKYQAKEQGQRGQGNGGGGFKIVHLRTYHTEQGEASNAEGGSLVDRLPGPVGNSIQIINNSAAERQNYSEQEIAEEAAIPLEEPQPEAHSPLPAEEHEMNHPQGLYQQPLNQIQPPQTLPISAIPTGYYLLYPSGVLWGVVLPGGCGQQ